MKKYPSLVDSEIVTDKQTKFLLLYIVRNNIFIFVRIQSNINDEQKKEIEILHKRIGQVRNEYVNQISGIPL